MNKVRVTPVRIRTDNNENMMKDNRRIKEKTEI